MSRTGHYVAVGNDPYSKAGDSLLSDVQKGQLGWVGNHDVFERTPNVVNRANILEASATLAMITEPQQTAWVRHLLLKVFELAHGLENVRVLLHTHDWLDEPLTGETHPHLFPHRRP